jgi:hypothetical protein
MLRKQLQLVLSGDERPTKTWHVLGPEVRAELVEQYARLIARAAKTETTSKEGSDADGKDNQ